MSTDTISSSKRAKPGSDYAARVATKLYGIDAAAMAVDGYADPSFILSTDDEPSYVLKITGRENEQLARLQNAILAHLSGQSLPLEVPSLVADSQGRGLSFSTDEAGNECCLQLLTYLPGEFAADLPAARPALLRSIGRGLGALSRALTGFTHTGAARLHRWHLQKAPEVFEAAPLARELRPMVERSLEGFQRRVVPALACLRRSVIHGDANDHNLLVSARPGRGLQASGLIDFGDAAEAPTVFEAAIAMAYFMMRQPRPVLAAQELLAAYHSEMALLPEEIELLYDLVCARLCMTISHAARARHSAPDNAYLLRSEKGAIRLLRELHEIEHLFFTASMRDACRLSAWPQGEKLSDWLSRQSPSPLLPSLHEGAPRILDFTPGSEDLGAGIAPKSLREFEGLVESLLRSSGTVLGIGRYAEIRGLYQSEVFAKENNDEARTVHLGVDLFAPAGTPVSAPLEGTVHSFADNARPLDYGPTIILEHRIDGAPGSFFTLYGHLERRSITGLEVGQVITAGEVFAWIGEPEVNGGWPAHLHFQITGDMLGKRGDFPGVARHSEIAVWKALCPNPARFVGLTDKDLDANCGMSPEELARRRDLCLSPSLSLAFANPIKVVRGRGAYLFTEQGRKILDLINNVAHVGHAHPRVVAAIAQQEAQLNTNTRYLHDGLVTYAERLTALLPDELDTCFLVCTGSEANELALRLARAYTGGSDVVVVDGAYHGHSSALIDLSPYKFNGAGGAGRAPHVQVAAMPDAYNGVYADDPASSDKYVQSVGDAFARVAGQGRKAAAFFCESALGCGGQIILPSGYLQRAYHHARSAGAVCVADEVQVGFGRLGGELWAFEAQGVVPDILTLGKPIGNGYPLAAVVTRREIAEAFANGMEYFNTFGGNPVACAAGHAVLDVLLDEALPARAGQLGARWLEALHELEKKNEIVGDVRGQGLFIGIELVKDRQSREANPEAARAVLDALRQKDIQISIDGPRYNVLKIKPPMVIEEQDMERVSVALGEAINNLARK